MLRENTGRQMLDSGDYYGRNWQRNQFLDFDAQPESIMETYVRKGELDLSVTHNVYHWLSERLEYQLSDYSASEDPADRGKGIIYVEDRHTIYCPVSGYRLAVSSM